MASYIDELPAMHQFLYNVHEYGSPLKSFSSSEFVNGIGPVLERHNYQLTPAGLPEYAKAYETDERDARYLLVVTLDRFTIIFFVKDDVSLVHWKNTYAATPQSLLLKMFLPAERRMPEGMTFQMNLRRAFSRG